MALLSGRRRWAWLGYLTFFLVACQSSVAVPTATPTLSPTSPPISTSVPSPIAAPVANVEQLERYMDLADNVINGIVQLTRVISSISIGVTRSTTAVREAAETVEAVKGSFEITSLGLEKAEPPPGYEELHARLLDALRFYTDASAALLPDGETGEANYSKFQEFMLEGGKNSHAAIALFQELRPQKD